jgi:hypothetical protein
MVGFALRLCARATFDGGLSKRARAADTDRIGDVTDDH